MHVISVTESKKSRSNSGNSSLVRRSLTLSEHVLHLREWVVHMEPRFVCGTIHLNPEGRASQRERKFTHKSMRRRMSARDSLWRVYLPSSSAPSLCGETCAQFHMKLQGIVNRNPPVLHHKLLAAVHLAAVLARLLAPGCTKSPSLVHPDLNALCQPKTVLLEQHLFWNTPLNVFQSQELPDACQMSHLLPFQILQPTEPSGWFNSLYEACPNEGEHDVFSTH